MVMNLQVTYQAKEFLTGCVTALNKNIYFMKLIIYISRKLLNYITFN